MIYDEPRIRPLGDTYLLVEFGDEAELALNFRVLQLTNLLSNMTMPGVVEILPSMRSLGIIYDRRRTRPQQLADAIRALQAEVVSLSTIPSRLMRLPVWYEDPWSRQLAEDNHVQNNIRFVAEINGLTVRQVIEYHTSTQFWVAYLGSNPGTYLAFALDRSKALSAPKYRLPRIHTPARMLGLGGLCTGAYATDAPGGYQVIGRLAVNIYEPAQRNRIFRTSPFLVRPTDRHQYYSVEREEYEELWRQCEKGTWECDVTEGEFDIAAYLANRTPFRTLPLPPDSTGGDRTL